MNSILSVECVDNTKIIRLKLLRAVRTAQGPWPFEHPEGAEGDIKSFHFSSFAFFTFQELISPILGELLKKGQHW